MGRISQEVAMRPRDSTSSLQRTMSDRSGGGGVASPAPNRTPQGGTRTRSILLVQVLLVTAPDAVRKVPHRYNRAVAGVSSRGVPARGARCRRHVTRLMRLSGGACACAADPREACTAAGAAAHDCLGRVTPSSSRGTRLPGRRARMCPRLSVQRRAAVLGSVPRRQRALHRRGA